MSGTRLQSGAPGVESSATRYSCPLRMTLPAPTYDLMLLSTPRPRSPRAPRSSPTRSPRSTRRASCVRQDDWGERALAYPIDRKANADYHLLQFHVGQIALLDSLDRTLRITDGVLRHRIIKLAPGTPTRPR